MLRLVNQLDLGRCPHCNVDSPNLFVVAQINTNAHSGGNLKYWKVYKCIRCGGLVTSSSKDPDGQVLEIFPNSTKIEDTIPEKAKNYLSQALNSLHAPAGSVMLSASAVDAMLKEKNYKEGSLYSRINKAAKDHLITDDMSKWAHEIRLDANDQRHADEEVPIPNETDAKRCLDFALALADFLFVLPSRVSRGLEESNK
ncbi:MAG: DUF4145 domain-containing protein [Patescibacteria group bacterium]|nr:DUF4145 domain-containing protein [Patescibacteria group bacterium]